MFPALEMNLTVLGFVFCGMLYVSDFYILLCKTQFLGEAKPIEFTLTSGLLIATITVQACNNKAQKYERKRLKSKTPLLSQ